MGGFSLGPVIIWAVAVAAVVIAMMWWIFG